MEMHMLLFHALTETLVVVHDDHRSADRDDEPRVQSYMLERAYVRC